MRLWKQKQPEQELTDEDKAKLKRILDKTNAHIQQNINKWDHTRYDNAITKGYENFMAKRMY